MIKITKQKLYIILLYIVVTVVGHYFGEYYNTYDAYKNRMYDDFEDFGMEIESLNDHLSQLLTLGVEDFDPEKKVVNRRIMLEFWRSNNDAADLGKGKWCPAYIDDLYLDVNHVIENIVSDNKISPSERKYIQTLYAYNDEILKEYRNVVGDMPERLDFDKMRKLEKKIIKIYNDYSKEAEDLLNTSKYRGLKDYKGELTAESLENVQAYCQEIFSKLVENKTLKYNKEDGKNADQYVFETDLKEYDPKDIAKDLMNGNTEYRLTYDKKTKKIDIYASSYGTSPNSKKYTEKELDNMAEKIMTQFSDQGFNYDKKISYDEQQKIQEITYAYIEKNEGVYDEIKKMQLEIQSSGLITGFERVYPYHEPITMPVIKKEAILSKIDKEAKIIDDLLIRNIEGKTQYVFHLKYKNTLYESVFDADTGALSYYGREIRHDYLK
ncbi:hypothetical protein [Marinisporobacter balticus]|uniref:Uncharacterized protein n=1 Tax=Marinisporobacter balticus TaxID=2018667 RepID=A0A4R2KZR5_9FIRM|nr:hypothetical protein [Marinisporobacter balticus]TCO76886.1 hypothetical protein EV214_10743 [Marinisporobacter balticus]